MQVPTVGRRQHWTRSSVLPTMSTHSVVGAAGFEPAVSCSRSRRDTRLRYAPLVPKAGVSPAPSFVEKAAILDSHLRLFRRVCTTGTVSFAGTGR